MTVNNTLNYYKKNAEQFIEQTAKVNMQSLYAPFIELLPNVSPNKQCILDLGCGSGRDSFYFAKKEFEVTAVDGSQELISLAKKTDTSAHTINWYCLKFSQLDDQNWYNKFTGIWACASLLHIPYEDLPNIIDTLVNMLSAHGVIYASFKYGNSERVNKDRFFCDLNEERWTLIKTQLSKRIEDNLWITQDKRVNREDKWLNLLIKPF